MCLPMMPAGPESEVMKPIFTVSAAGAWPTARTARRPATSTRFLVRTVTSDWEFGSRVSAATPATGVPGGGSLADPFGRVQDRRAPVVSRLVWKIDPQQQRRRDREADGGCDRRTIGADP